jgi:hypothetical protein
MIKNQESLENEKIQSSFQFSSYPPIRLAKPFVDSYFPNLLMPIPQKLNFCCYIKREKSFFKKDAYLLYRIFGDRYLLSGFLKRGKTCAMYLLGTDEDNNMYDRMEAKKDRRQFLLTLKGHKTPELILQYTGSWAMPQSRKFQVACFPNNHRSQSFKIQNFQKNQYQLFGKKNITTSLKNFILVHEQKKCIQFAKISDSIYFLKIAYPFSIIEGFALACAAMNNGSFQI